MVVQKFAISLLLKEFAEELLNFVEEQADPSQGQYWVGTFADYASFVESGTEGHKTSEDQSEFIEDITEWAQDHGIENVYGLIEHIRDQGTEPHPYYRPAVLSVGRSTEGITVDTSGRGRIDLQITEDFDGSVENVAERVKQEMKRRVPVHQGDLKRSIVKAPTKAELQKKSLQQLGSDD